MVSQRINNTIAPPIVEIGNLIRSVPGTINLGQGVPYYYPDSFIFDEFKQTLNSEVINQYSADPGIKDLRLALKDKLKVDNKISTSIDEITITNGANQAFVNVLFTIADPGDKIGLISPYYFNHYMAAQIGNIDIIEIPLTSDYRLSIEQIKNAIKAGVKAIVLINPGNPTGIIHSEDELKELGELISQSDVVLISDETYEYFTYAKQQHKSTSTVHSLKNNTITIGSFSKTYGIPGWRLGYYVSNSEFMNQAIKIQDTTTICAPVPAQLLGLTLLKYRKKLIPKFVGLMQENHKLAKDLIDEISWLDDEPAKGAYYLFPKQLTGLNSIKLGEILVKEHKIGVLPGIGFGKDFGSYFRISFANVKPDILHEGLERLKKYNS